MTRARAAWLAAGVVVLAAVAYLVRRRATRPAPVAVSAPRVTATPAQGTSTPEVATLTAPAPTQPSPIEEQPPVRTEVPEVAEDREQPLATWARVAIVVIALLAFFAVSLIATKQV